MLADILLARVYGMKRGWCLTLKDFLDLGSQSAIWQALSRLEKKGVTRKIMCRGYDYPKKDPFLEGCTSPDPERVAKTIARGNSWNSVSDETTALKLLGLSTQIHAEWSYPSDGQCRRYVTGWLFDVLKRAADLPALKGGEA